MQRTGVDFEGAFVGQTGATAFHVVDALAEGNAALLELKMQQCITSGEDAAPILKAVAAFLRQLAQVYAGRERTSNLDAVFDNLNVRVPAQKKRLQVAMNRISPERVALFFMHAPELELSLRSHPMPHELLASELFGLLGVSAR
jgi:DNA polymerase III delta subunit